MTDNTNLVDELLVPVPDYMQKVKCDAENCEQPFKCAVNICPNVFIKSERPLPYKFHNFPTIPNQEQIWKQKCGLSPYLDVSNLKVCSDHFHPDDYIRNYKEEFTNAKFRRKLQPTAVPHRNLGPEFIAIVDESTFGSNIVKDEVDLNEKLKAHVEKLEKEQAKLLQSADSLLKKTEMRKKQIRNIQKSLRSYRATQNQSDEDASLIRKVFSEAQIKLLMGKRVCWTDDDLAMAFSLRHIGNKKCYNYLKNTLNLPLPALACVQRWATKYVDED